jgi:hypothetical protein
MAAISFAFYIFVTSSDDGRNCLPKHVAYMRNECMSEHLCCFVGLINIEDIALRNATRRLYSGFQTQLLARGLHVKRQGTQRF